MEGARVVRRAFLHPHKATGLVAVAVNHLHDLQHRQIQYSLPDIKAPVRALGGAYHFLPHQILQNFSQEMLGDIQFGSYLLDAHLPAFFYLRSQVNHSA
ncbi:hypothetical protein D9M69_583640 [compost metagenome]